MQRGFVTALLFALLFFMVFTLELHAPIHSDDYWFIQRALDLHETIRQYMTWSGRLIADLAATVLLRIHSNIVRSIIQSIGLFALIATVTEAGRGSSDGNPVFISS